MQIPGTTNGKLHILHFAYFSSLLYWMFIVIFNNPITLNLFGG